MVPKGWYSFLTLWGTVKETIVITVCSVGECCSTCAEIKLPDVCCRQQKKWRNQKIKNSLFFEVNTEQRVRVSSANQMLKIHVNGYGIRLLLGSTSNSGVLWGYVRYRKVESRREELKIIMLREAFSDGWLPISTVSCLSEISNITRVYERNKNGLSVSYRLRLLREK